MALNSSNFQILVAATLDAANIQKQLNSISQKYGKIKIDLDVNTTTLNEASNSLNNLRENITSTGTAAENTSQSIGDIITKVTKFGAATLVINEFRKAIMDGYEAVKDLDASVTEYRKVSDLTDSQMKGFIEDARELGLTVARTADEMVEAATEFKKMGNDDSTSLILGQQAVMFQNIADEAISAGDSASFINSQMKAFNFTASETIHILDAVNEVANNFAVSSGDISTALPKVASTMALAGNSFEETIGLLTAGAEIIPNQASRIARGLRSITLNLQGLNEDGEAVAGMVASMEEDFNKLGITLMDEQGQIKSTYEIFSELAEVFPRLDKNTQTYYASLIGGKTQVDVVTAILKNFNTAIEATETAINSAGSAMTENEKYLDSIQGRIAALTSEFQKFWTEGISSELVKDIVSFGKSTLELINNLGGLPTVLTAVAGAILTIKGYDIINSLGRMGNSLISTIGLIVDLRRDGFSLIEMFTGLRSSAQLTTAAIGGLTAALTIGVAIYGHYKAAQEEAKRSALQAAETFNQEADSLYELKNKYNEVLDSQATEEVKAAKLAGIREELADKYGIEEEALDSLNETRVEGNKLLDEEIQKRAEETYAKNIDLIKEAQEYLTNDMQLRFGTMIGNNLNDDVFNELDDIFSKISQKAEGMIVNLKGTPEELSQALVQAINYMSELENPTQNEIDLLGRFKNELRDLTGNIDDYNSTINTTQQAYLLANDSIKEFLSTSFQTKEEMLAAKKEVMDTLVPLDSYRKGFDNIVKSAFPEWADNAKEKNEELNVEMQNGAKEAEEFAKKMKSLASELSGTQDAYDTLTAVAKEYNSTGSLTADTLASLLKLNPQYYEALSMQNGQLVVNTDMLNQMAQGYATAAYEALTGSTGINTFATALNDTASAGADASQRIAEAGDAAVEAGRKALESAQGFKELIGSIGVFANTLKNGLSGDNGDGTKNYGHQFDSQVEAYKKNEQDKLLADLFSGISIDTSTKGKKGGGKSSKDDAEKAAREAAKAYKQAFQDELDEAKFKLDTGQINAGEYYLELDRLNKKYFEGNEEYLDEYRKYYLQVVNGLHDATVDNYDTEHDKLDHKLAMDLISEEEYLRELKRLYAEYLENQIGYEEEKNRAQEEIYNLEKKRIQKLKEQRKKAWDEETDWLNEQKSRYETAFNYIDSLAQKEIDALEEQKKAIEDKYNAEIDKIKEAEDALNDEIALQEKLEALAKAQNKKVRIYREGQGFVYETDQAAVDEAKEALTQFQKEQDTKKEIKRLEDIRDATIESVDEQIKYWEKYRQEWKDMVNSYTDAQNKLIAEQVLGISLEGENWEKRLGNLQDYVDRYNSILSQLKHRGDYEDGDDWDGDDDYDYGSGGSGPTIGPSDHAGSGGHWDSSDSSHGPGVAANGTTIGQGLTMVGEKGRELRVLGDGPNEADGIIPNHLTENLMKLGQYSPREWMNSVSKMGTNQCSAQYSYAFDSLVLPNVTNADSFISELKNLKNQAIQMGGRRN